MRIFRTYDELIEIPTFLGRFEYLSLGGKAGVASFGSSRYLHQMFYRSQAWKDARDEAILRDCGCDLAVDGMDINGSIYVHHINPIDSNDVVSRNPMVVDPNNLVCVTYATHKAIHYGTTDMLMLAFPVERKPNDTCPWKGAVK